MSNAGHVMILTMGDNEIAITPVILSAPPVFKNYPVWFFRDASWAVSVLVVAPVS